MSTRSKAFPLAPNAHVLIAGAGLLGRLLAWRLLLNEYRVTLCEQSSFARPVSAAHTAAAMISPMSEVVVSERAIYDYGVTSLQIWPQWIAELNRGLSSPIHYMANGSLALAHPGDASELDQFYHDLCYHLGKDHPARWLDQSQLRELEPDIAGQFDRGLYLPDEACLDNRHLLTELLATIENLGGVCRDQTRVTVNDATLAIELNGTAVSDVDCLLDCRGMGSAESRNDLRGVRGEVLWVHSEEIQLRHAVRLMHPRYKLYVVPKPGNKFIIGATEIESQDRSPVTVQSALELCSALYTLNPAFAEARILEMDANLRPSFWDNMPRIDTQSYTDDSGQARARVQINGLYRHGYLLAPALIQQCFTELGIQ